MDAKCYQEVSTKNSVKTDNMAHMTEKEAYQAGLIDKPKTSKYMSKKAKCSDGEHLHDSGHEANVCSELKLQQRAGDFVRFRVQVPFEIHPPFVSFTGRKIREIKYIADFVIEHHNGIVEIADAKGKATELFKVKWKLLQYSLKDSRKCDYIFTLK